MDSQNQKLIVKNERTGVQQDSVSLRDVPLEVRRKEAKRPLFLIRYE